MNKRFRGGLKAALGRSLKRAGLRFAQFPDLQNTLNTAVFTITDTVTAKSVCQAASGQLIA